MEPGPRPLPVPQCTPGVSLHGSWCKAPLINLPKLVCVCAGQDCVPLCLNIYCRLGDRSPKTKKKGSQALGWSVSDAWRKERKKESPGTARKWEKKTHKARGLTKRFYSTLHTLTDSFPKSVLMFNCQIEAVCLCPPSLYLPGLVQHVPRC